ncbi:MAG: cbb3-type cytochrome oxidase assembly protein CcoS [FCB group bacterium]|nr:cbb3-type cytochrome oxidase assembly protein CcoS [FCB group bacterium]
MSVLFVLIGASLLLAVGFLAAFLWAIHNGQFDDGVTPSMRMLMDGQKHPQRPKKGEQHGG